MLRQDIATMPTPTPDNHEIELKFLTTAQGFKSSQLWPALSAEPKPRNAQRLHTRYFDTENADLERHDIVLRVRKQGRTTITTLKWSGNFAAGMFARGEVEAASPGPDPDIAALGPEYTDWLAGIIQKRELIAVYETDIRRITRRITSQSSDIEIAFDSGFIRAADLKLAVREIELELKSGDPAELYRLGIALAEAYPVRLGTQAKSERGAQLRRQSQPKIIRSTSPLTGTPSIDEAIGTTLNACLAQFAGNFPAFESGDSVTAVHQMRVAMRRFRSLLSLFQREFPCAEFTVFRDQAKQIATILGGCRNWDVFLQLLRDGPAAAFPDQAGFAPIIAAAEQCRQAEAETIATLLASPQTTCFILSVQAFIARRGWRNALSPEALARLTQPARGFAAANINRIRGKGLKQGKHLQSLPPHQRHELRICLKKLRYAADMFAGLFDQRRELRGLLASASRLQDLLGAYNDLVCATDLLDQLDLSGTATTYAAGIIAGWCRHGAEPNDEILFRAWKKFRKVKKLTI